MHTGPISVARLRQSVVSVPPLARANDHSIDLKQNERLLAHMRAGGVSTFLYGGNANLYNMGVREFEKLLDMLEQIAAPDDWMIPSIGADYGKACDQVDVLKARRFPTAMVLPLRFPATPAGIATGIRRLSERFGRPLTAYVKDEGFILPEDLGALARDGAICSVKYAIVRTDPASDDTLKAILQQVDPDIVVSGIGERPVLDHASVFGLKAFTSGSVCVAPRLSTEILKAIHAGRMDAAEDLRRKFLPLEDLRDAHSPLRVLHEAVRLADIADTGPMEPFLSNIEEGPVSSAIGAAAKALLAENDAAAKVRA